MRRERFEKRLYLVFEIQLLGTGLNTGVGR
jgi:hypothetical protein